MHHWDRHAIKAEIYRRGQTLTGLARSAGLPDNAVRYVLTGSKRWARAEQAIADFIGQPVDSLFPLRCTNPRRRDSGTSRRRRQRRVHAKHTTPQQNRRKAA